MTIHPVTGDNEKGGYFIIRITFPSYHPEYKERLWSIVGSVLPDSCTKIILPGRFLFILVNYRDYVRLKELFEGLDGYSDTKAAQSL